MGIQLTRTLYIVFFLLIAFMVAGLLYIPTTQAQIPTQTISLSTTPTTPQPNAEVTVSLNAYTINTTGATIQWLVDGVERTNSRNKRSITLTTKDTGIQTVVRAVVTQNNGYPIAATLVITPADVDIIIESDSFIPTFYKGRALPSYSSKIRAIALPQVGGIDPKTLNYTWRTGQTVLFGGSGVGNNVVEFDLPRFGNPDVSVTVADRNGNLLAEKALRIDIAETEVLFYEQNPLRGALESAIEKNLNIANTETSIEAVPYFINSETISKADTISWQVGGKNVANPADNPLMLTLRPTGGNGQSSIRFDIVDRDYLLQRAAGKFTVIFQ